MTCDSCGKDVEPQGGRVPDGWFAVDEDNGATGTTHFCSADCLSIYYAQLAPERSHLADFRQVSETDTAFWFEDSAGRRLTVPKQ